MKYCDKANDAISKVRYLLSRTVRTDTGCLEFQGACNEKGYAIAQVSGRLERVHRAVFMYLVDEVPEGKFVCHSCDNRKCINPEHLWIGDAFSNMQDMVKKGRYRNSRSKPLNMSEKEKIIDMAKDGYLYKTIGELFDIHTNRVGRIARKAGIKRIHHKPLKYGVTYGNRS